MSAFVSAFIDFFRRHRLFKHFCLAVAAGLLVLAAVFTWLGVYTRHGYKEVVPEVRGLSREEAMRQLEARQLALAVSDSVYNRTYEPSRIIEQDPKPGEFVKPGRRVYVVINSATRPQVPFPPVVDMSLRQARATLEGAEFTVDRVIYQPSDYKDLVLSAVYDGRVVREGDRVPVGASITLCVGQGAGSAEVQDDPLGDEIENNIRF